MKITTMEKTTKTIIKCDANDLRQSNSLSDSFGNLLRNAFNYGSGSVDSYCQEDEEDELEEDCMNDIN